MVNIGYARVSTEEQSLDLQLDALKAAGCQQVFSDQGMSGKTTERPGLTQAMAAATAGGKLVVWRLDRLGRSLPHLIKLIDELGARGIQFHSLMENIDTSSSSGRLIFHIMGALAEFERNLISERTRAGMAAARVRGARLGRRSALSALDVCQLKNAHKAGAELSTLTNKFGVTERTLRRYLKHSMSVIAVLSLMPIDGLCGGSAVAMPEGAKPVGFDSAAMLTRDNR
ncbi:recombinase family protein [Rhizobium sp. AG855]|uniref:recombinase family protein n=1 Tax=Rhizobium sp. AG855 TaxID=2183898 RepID=UPI000FF45EEA|nr:DNA invertase Pin-like site-specific DNA recombinase [Rhizobium sp. AG855]